MAYGRNYRKRNYKRGGRKSKFKKLASKVSKLAAQVVQKQVCTVNANTVGTAGVYLLLNGMFKGDDYYSREGSRVNGKSVQLRMSFVPDSTFVTWRVILCYWKVALGVAPAAPYLLGGNTNAGVTTGAIVNAPYRYTSKQQFQVLKDMTFIQPGMIESTDGALDSYTKMGAKQVVWNVNLKNHKTEYTAAGNAGDITDINNGALYLFILTDNNTNLGSYQVTSAYNFTDG